MRPEDMDGWDNPVVQEEPVGLDLEADPVTAIDEEELESDLRDETEEVMGGPDALADNLLVEFVETANARDMESLAELLDQAVEADFLAAHTRESVIGGLHELFLTYPTMVLTRGDLGVDPIAVAWLADPEEARFDPIGYFGLEVIESEDPLIGRLIYVEGLPETDDLVIETPEDADHPEWDDWED